MNTEKVLDFVDHAAEKAGDFAPQPRTRIGNTLPQAFDEVAADFCHFTD